MKSKFLPRNLIITLVIAFHVIIGLNSSKSTARQQLTYGPLFAGATTFTQNYPVTTPMTWAKTGELVFEKYQQDTNLLFTAQVTFIMTDALPWGVQFKLRFRTDTGTYIGDTPITGEVNKGAWALQNCMLSDTVLDVRYGQQPPAGNYVAELWAQTGGGELQVAGYTTNILLWEMPRFITPE